MKLLRKATATVALLTLVSGYFSVGVNAYSTAQLEAANALAAEGIIVTQDDAAGYALDQQVLRQEIAAVARWVAGLEKTTVCNNVFADVSKMVPNNWACYSIEALYNEGLIASNDTFRPEANISKAEAVGMMVKAAYGSEYEYNDALSTTWQEQVVAFAVEKGIISSFSNYDTAATRGFVFEVGANAMDDEEDEEDLLGELLGELLGDDEDMDDEDTTTEDDEDMDDEDTTVTISGDDVLEITLSPSTPEEATVPGYISGLPVAKFDFTAGNEDVTITSLTVKRKGLSDKNTLTDLAVFSDYWRASKAKNDSQENNTQALLTLSNWGFVIQAWETETITIVADIAESWADKNADGVFGTAWDEFAIQLLDVVATSDVEMDTLIGETMTVGGVDAAALVIKQDGTVSDVKVADDDVEIFKFKIEWANDEDVILKSITFKWEGTIDEEDELSNFQLEFDDEIVAEVDYANGKYVTFDLEDGIVIAEGKTEKFKVLANIDGWVNKTIAFKIDKTLDVSAEGTKYGFGASVDISAVDAADGLTAGTNDLGVLSVDAGELTLVDTDAPSDKIRSDKDDVELGSIKVTNVSGDSLELQTFAVDVEVSSTAFIDDGIGWGIADNGIQDGGELAATLATIFENFEVEINGTSYELTVAAWATLSSTYSDTDLTVTLPEWVTEMVISADTKKHISAGTKVSLNVTNIGTTGFKAVELEDEVAVSDITPSSLSFKDVEFITSGAKLSSVPLADATVVRGSDKIVANQFELKAEEASFVELDEVQVRINGYTAAAAQVDKITFAGTETDAANEILTTTITDAGGTATFTTTVIASTAATAATTVVSAVTHDVTWTSSQTYTVTEAAGVVTITAWTVNIPFTVATVNTTPGATTDITVASSVTTTHPSVAVAATDAQKVISSVVLYKDSVSESNILKTKWGNDVSSTWLVTFDSFKTKINANATKTFIVVLNLVDGIDAVGKILSADVMSVSGEDDDSDDVIVTGTALNNKAITVSPAGSFTVTYDSDNDANKDNKTLLAGTANIVASYDVQSKNEDVDVETVKVTFDNTTNLSDSFLSARLLLDGVEVGTASNSDLVGAVVTFDDLTNLEIPTENVELEVEVTTSNIGFEKVGKAIAANFITSISLEDVIGIDSGKTVDVQSETANAKTFAVTDVILTASLDAQLDDGTAKLRLTADYGDNTQATSNSSPVVTLSTLRFTDNGNGALADNEYKVYEEGETPGAFAPINSATNDTEVAKISFTDEVVVYILPKGVADATYALSLQKAGITYNGATTNNMSNELDLGSKTY